MILKRILSPSYVSCVFLPPKNDGFAPRGKENDGLIVHFCLKCTSVWAEPRLLQAPGSLNENKQTQPLLDKHKHANTHHKETPTLSNAWSEPQNSYLTQPGHMTAAGGLSGEGGAGGGRVHGGLAMPSVLPDFGTKV